MTAFSAIPLPLSFRALAERMRRQERNPEDDCIVNADARHFLENDLCVPSCPSWLTPLNFRSRRCRAMTAFSAIPEALGNDKKNRRAPYVRHITPRRGQLILRPANRGSRARFLRWGGSKGEGS